MRGAERGWGAVERKTVVENGESQEGCEEEWQSERVVERGGKKVLEMFRGQLAGSYQAGKYGRWCNSEQTVFTTVAESRDGSEQLLTWHDGLFIYKYKFLCRWINKGLNPGHSPTTTIHMSTSEYPPSRS